MLCVEEGWSEAGGFAIVLLNLGKSFVFRGK